MWGSGEGGVEGGGSSGTPGGVKKEINEMC